MKARQNGARLQYAGRQRRRRLAARSSAAARDAGAAEHELFEPGEHGALQTARPYIGHQRDSLTACDEFGRQRLGGEEVSARAACGDDDGMHCGSSHGLSP